MQVIDKSPASIIGVQRGDVITEVNGQKISTVQDFYTALREQAKSQLWFGVQRGDGNNTIETLRFRR
jgi:S1-C subfamily serine protease